MKVEELVFDSRRDWLEARRTRGLGSSDAAVILGISRYKSRFQLYQEKLGVESPTKAENEQIEWGNILEEPISKKYALETGRSVRNPRLPGQFTMERSLDIDFMVAAVDRYTFNSERPEDDEGVLEIKNAHFFVGKSWLDLQEPPLEFQVQLQHQLAVTGKRWGSIAALIGGCRFVWADIPRDEEFITLLVKAEEEFWNLLLRRTPPDPDGSDLTTAAVNRMFTRETSGQIITLGPEYLDVHTELAEAKAALKAAAFRKNEAENVLKLAIGENTGARLPSGAVFTWKSQTRKAHTVKESTFRVLRVTEPKGPALPAGKVALELEDMPELEMPE